MCHVGQECLTDGGDMDPYVLILCMLLVGSGSFWAGSGFTFLLFDWPSAKAIGPDVHDLRRASE